MDNKIISALTPINKKGEIDQRYEPHIRNIVDAVGKDSLDRLERFQEATTQLEIKVRKDALNLAIAFLREATSITDNPTFYEYGGTNKWMSDGLREHACKAFQAIGFKPKNASKITRAAEFRLFHKYGPPYDAWFKELDLSHLDVLSRMSSDGIKAAADEVKYEDFHLIAGTKSISVRRLEQIQRQYPKNPHETRGHKSNNSLPDVSVLNDDPNPDVIEETIEPTQYQLADELVSIVNRIDTKAGWKDPKLIEILSLEKQALMNVAHIATLPVNKPITV